MPLPSPAAFRIELDPRSGGTLYAIGSTGIFRSTDGGSSWEPRGKGYAIAFAIDPQNPATLYAGALRGELWKSVDAGGTWQPTGSALPPEVYSLLVDPFAPGTLYAGVVRGGLFMSLDGAATWVRADRGLIGSAVEALALDSTNPRRILAGTATLTKYDSSDLYLSEDGGRNWTALNTFWDIQALAIDPNDPAAIFIGSGFCKGGYCPGGILKSSDGGRSWSGLLSGYLVRGLAVNPGNSRTILAETWGVSLRSKDGGTTWETLGGGLPKSGVGPFVFDQSNSSVVYAASEEGVLRSADEGTTWTSSSVGLTDPSVSTLAIDPQTQRVIYAGTKSGLFKTSDGGGTWRGTGFAKAVTAIAVDPVDSRVLFVSGDSPGLFRSVDGGETWGPVPLDSSGSLSTARIAKLAIDSAGHSLHAATDFGVWELELREPVFKVSPRS